MFRFTLSRTLTLVSVGTALLSAATLASLHGSTANRALQSDPPHQVADSLDSLIQPRFQDDRAGVFGLTRVVTPEQLAGVAGHEGLALLQPKSPTEAALLHQANAAKRDYVVGFLHCAHVPGHMKGFPGQVNANVKPYLRLLAAPPSPPSARQAHTFQALLLGPSRLGQTDYAAISRQSIAALPSLRHGTSQEANVNNWLVVMRPITAGKDSCLGCHEGAKKGDTLGVMVYAVSKKPATGA